MNISVVIPTLNEAATIDEALAALERAGPFAEVIVADGGSGDGTAERAASRARLVRARRGRGAQMNAGAGAARGDALLFLHADGRLPRGAAAAIRDAFQDPTVVGGHFQVRFSGHGRNERFLTSFYDALRRLGVVYGDAAIFVRRSAFEKVGGFRDFPIMEDLDLVNRLRRTGRVVALPQVVVASSRRWQRGGVLRTWAAWVVIQSLYFLGVHPRTLGRLYSAVR